MGRTHRHANEIKKPPPLVVELPLSCNGHVRLFEDAVGVADHAAARALDVPDRDARNHLLIQGDQHVERTYQQQGLTEHTALKGLCWPHRTHGLAGHTLHQVTHHLLYPGNALPGDGYGYVLPPPRAWLGSRTRHRRRTFHESTGHAMAPVG